MNANDIIELIRAGYTKADIDALENPEEKKPDDLKTEEKKPEDLKTEEKKPDKPNPNDRVAVLETKIDYLVNRLNLLAVQTSTQKDAPTETVDDILASMVRGNKKEG